MMKDEVIRLNLELRKLQAKHEQVLENLRRQKVSARGTANNLATLQKVSTESGLKSQEFVVNELQKQLAVLKRKLNIPGHEHVQTVEMARLDTERNDLQDSLDREIQEKARIREEMTVLRQKLDEVQKLWDTHSCPIAPPQVPDSSADKLTTALAQLNVAEKQTHTTQQRVQELEGRLKKRDEQLATVQRELDQSQKQRGNMEKEMEELKGRVKGNITLLESRRLIWTEVISEIKQCWPFLEYMDQKKVAASNYRRRLHEGHEGAASRAEWAKKYSIHLHSLAPEGLVALGITDRFQEAVECRKVIDKEEVRAKALASLQRMAKVLSKFEIGWREVVQAGLPSCWDSTTGALFSQLAYEGKLKIEMNSADTVSEKTMRLKAETIIAALGKEFRILHHVKDRLSTQMNYADIADTHLLAGVFSSIVDPAADTWQRCVDYNNCSVSVVPLKKAPSTTSSAPGSSATFTTPVHQKK